MDRNQDGRISDDELRSYLVVLAAEIERKVSIKVDADTIPLVPLFEPEAPFQDRLVPDAGPQVLRINLFARTPKDLRAGSRIRVEDRLWLNDPAIVSARAAGQGGMNVVVEPGAEMSPAGLDGTPRVVDIRCSAVPSLTAVGSLDDRILLARDSQGGGTRTPPPPSLGAALWFTLLIPLAALVCWLVRSRSFEGGQIVKKALCTIAPCLVLLTFLSQFRYGAAQTESSPGITEFVSTLVRDHIYLFNPADRQVLAEMNRQLQELRWLARRSRNTGSQAELATMGRSLVANVLPLLEHLPLLRTVSLEGGNARLWPESPVILPGDAGAVLLRVDNGEGEPTYSTTAYDFSTIGAQRAAVVNLSAPGPRWLLISLSNIPTGRTTLMVSLENGEQRRALHVPITTPTFGRLKVAILSDDTGKPAPAMVRLVWKTADRDRKPPNAVELAPQFDSLGNASSRRPANLPGQSLQSFWWLVPGPFDVAVPPGDWEITIRRGVEHVPVADTFRVEEGAEVRKSYRPRRWVDMRKHGWYSGDDHVHGRILSNDDAANLMAWVQAEDIHVANVVEMGDISRTFFDQRGFGPQHRVVDRDYILAPGQECPRTHDELGHTLSMNIRSMIRDTDRYFLYDWVFDRVQEEGGLSGYAHVLDDNFHVHRDMTLNVPKGKVDFAEIMQFGRLGTDLYYEFLNLGFKLTASAGSDVPWGGTVGEVRLYAYVGRQQRGGLSADAWFDAVDRGRTFVTNGPMLDFRVDQALPGDELEVKEDRKLKVRARAWGQSGHMVPVRLEIVRHGEVVKSVEPARRGQDELTADFEVDAGHGCWIAARALGSDQSEAFTTPVYIIRAPFRFWKIQSVSELIDKRLASLQEIEQIVEEARRTSGQSRQESMPAMRLLARHRLAEQGTALLERVAAARKTYLDLREVASRERAARAGLP
ncbi:MAG: CehA/McbA family metallohydrolase [Acidobacteriota bacterium]